MRFYLVPHFVCHMLKVIKRFDLIRSLRSGDAHDVLENKHLGPEVIDEAKVEAVEVISWISFHIFSHLSPSGYRIRLAWWTANNDVDRIAASKYIKACYDVIQCFFTDCGLNNPVGHIGGNLIPERRTISTFALATKVVLIYFKLVVLAQIMEGSPCS